VATLWQVLLAFAAVIAPLLLAGWLLARSGEPRERAERRPPRTPARRSDTIEP